MTVPTYQEWFLPFLQHVGDGKTHQMRDLYHALAEQFQLTEDDKAELLPSGRQLRYENNISWARSYLKAAGLLVAPQKGQIQITEKGLEILRQQPERIDNKFLRRFPSFVEFISAKKTDADGNGSTGLPDPLDSQVSPEEIIDQNYAIIRKQLAADLLEQILRNESVFFERLVVKLLVRMGYGGSLEDVGKAVGRSGDGGIAGIIKEDRLGLDVIYLQARRWTDKIVGSPDMNEFVGALVSCRAKKGVFITTSKFSELAKQRADQAGDVKIALIDGEDLAQLMIDHNLGVTVVTSYEIKRIDGDSFEED